MFFMDLIVQEMAVSEGGMRLFSTMVMPCETWGDLWLYEKRYSRKYMITTGKSPPKTPFLWLLCRRCACLGAAV